MSGHYVTFNGGLHMLHDCDQCDSTEERIFTDSWTGKELCLMCLSEIAGKITMSPASEGDNLPELLRELDG